jgi:hypothetical protein
MWQLRNHLYFPVTPAIVAARRPSQIEVKSLRPTGSFLKQRFGKLRFFCNGVRKHLKWLAWELWARFVKLLKVEKTLTVWKKINVIEVPCKDLHDFGSSRAIDIFRKAVENFAERGGLVDESSSIDADKAGRDSGAADSCGWSRGSIDPRTSSRYLWRGIACFHWHSPFPEATGSDGS